MKIKQVSEKYGIAIATLRYYEKIGLIGPVKRVNNIREYQPLDLERIEFIMCMKESNLSLEKMKEYFGYYEEGESTLEKRLELLSEHEKATQEKLTNMQASLDYIHFKINLTKENLKKREEKDKKIIKK